MHIVGDNMKAHIRKEKKAAPLKLGERTLFVKKYGEYHKVCDTVECDETHIDDDVIDEVIKFALSEENLLSERELWFIYGANNVYVN
jgi:hypothetical protein